MSLPMPSGPALLVREALAAVLDHAKDAVEAPDTEAMKRALNEVWHATHHAHEAIRDAERMTRELALLKAEQRDAA